MKRLASTAIAFCLCLALAAPALAQSADVSGWTKAEFMGCTFLYPPEFQVLEQDSTNLGVGHMDQATHQGVAFGFVKDETESVLDDMRSDAGALEELGPTTVGGQPAKLYKAVIDDPQMPGQASIIIFDKPLADGDSLIIVRAVANQDWNSQAPLLDQMLTTVTIDPAVFVPAPAAPDQAATDLDGTGQATAGQTTSGQTPALPLPGLQGQAQPPAPTVETPIEPAPEPASAPAAMDTTGWTKIEVLGKSSFLYPPDFKPIEQEEDGVMVGKLNEATHQGVVFGLGSDKPESVLGDMREQSASFEELGPVTISGQPGQAYKASMIAPDQGLAGFVKATVLDTLLPDGKKQILIMQIVTNDQWEKYEAVLETMLATVVIDPAVFQAEAEPAPATPSASAYRNGSIVLKDPRSYRDAVGRGEKLEPDGAPDARFILTIDGPGVLTGVRLHNMDGMYSEWDTTPGNELWAMAVYKGRDLLNNPDGSLRYELAEGPNKLDLFVQDNNAIAGGQTTLEVVLDFEDGSSWNSIIFK